MISQVREWAGWVGKGGGSGRRKEEWLGGTAGGPAPHRCVSGWDRGWVGVGESEACEEFGRKARESGGGWVRRAVGMVGRGQVSGKIRWHLGEMFGVWMVNEHEKVGWVVAWKFGLHQGRCAWEREWGRHVWEGWAV